MIKFDHSKIEIKRIKLKSINSMSGSIQVVDETVTDKEKTYKLECHNSITRLYNKTHGATYYTVPYECAILLYDGNIIALEKANINQRLSEGFDGESTEWMPRMAQTFKQVVGMMGEYNDWYIDGSYVYTFKQSLDSAVKEGKHLSSDGRFRSIYVTAIHLNYIGFTTDVYAESRTCLAYVANSGEYSIAPPVWKTLDSIGNTQIRKASAESENVGLTSQFDKVDNNLMVNLQFAIVAGIQLTRQFGYQSIEPLQLPRLMVQLNTVNLQQISTEVKQTFDIGLSFTQAMAWLLGINRRVTTYEEMITLKRLFRYLSANGIFSKKELNNIVQADSGELPLLDLTAVYEELKQSSQGVLDEVESS